MLIIGFVTGIVCRPHRIEKVVDIQRDTITKIDTHIVEKPILKETRITDTMYVAVTDTIRQRDTLYMRLEFETKTYKGEDYLAKVSGYNPSLYYIEVYPKTITVKESITKRIEPAKWHFSLDLGLNAGMSDRRYITPNIGVELGYDKWSITGEAGIDLNIMQDAVLSPQTYLELGFKYKLINK